MQFIVVNTASGKYYVALSHITHAFGTEAGWARLMISGGEHVDINEGVDDFYDRIKNKQMMPPRAPSR